MPLHNQQASTFSGFTILEMSIVLIIISLIIGSAVRPISFQLEQRKVDQTQHFIDKSIYAIYGFSIVNKHLPCPDFLGDGISSLTCAGEGGFLPWKTLTLNRGVDAWGNRIRYKADASLTTVLSTIKDVNSLSTHIAILDINGVSVAETEAGEATTAAVLYSCGNNKTSEQSADSCTGVSLVDTGTYVTDFLFFDDFIGFISTRELTEKLYAARAIR